MTEPTEALEYVADRFRMQGVVVQAAGIELVLKYLDEWYANEWNPTTDDTLHCIVYTDEERQGYIKERLPDVPYNIISDVLDAEDSFFHEHNNVE